MQTIELPGEKWGEHTLRFTVLPDRPIDEIRFLLPSGELRLDDVLLYTLGGCSFQLFEVLGDRLIAAIGPRGERTQNGGGGGLADEGDVAVGEDDVRSVAVE